MLGVAPVALAPVAAASGGQGSGGGGVSSASQDSSGHKYRGDSQHMGDRILQRGMQGHDVRVLQDYLGILGYHSPITGHFGWRTRKNLMGFQKANGLDSTGVLIYADSQQLRRVVAAKLKSEKPGKATISHGLAVPPANAPKVIREVIAAGNQIAFKPYLYGGGHGTWNSSGYDCSGSVSYALHGGHLLSTTMDSTQFESYGASGRGKWITLWTNAGHVYMYVAGLRFDTTAQGETGGSRWTYQGRSSAGFIDRHPRGW